MRIPFCNTRYKLFGVMLIMFATSVQAQLLNPLKAVYVESGKSFSDRLTFRCGSKDCRIDEDFLLIEIVGVP